MFAFSLYVNFPWSFDIFQSAQYMQSASFTSCTPFVVKESYPAAGNNLLLILIPSKSYCLEEFIISSKTRSSLAD